MHNRWVVRELNLTRPLKENLDTYFCFWSTANERHIVGMRPWHDFAQDHCKVNHQARSRKNGMVHYGLECEGHQVLPSSRCCHFAWMWILLPCNVVAIAPMSAITMELMSMGHSATPWPSCRCSPSLQSSHTWVVLQHRGRHSAIHCVVIRYLLCHRHPSVH